MVMGQKQVDLKNQNRNLIYIKCNHCFDVPEVSGVHYIIYEYIITSIQVLKILCSTASLGYSFLRSRT